jgi:hypothetical protein
MSRPAKLDALSFDDAMSVHVLRAAGVTYRELTQMFKEYPARLSRVLDGSLYAGSWDAAMERLSRGETWHPTVDALVRERGRDPVVASVKGANPCRRQYRQQLKRLRKCTIPFIR